VEGDRGNRCSVSSMQMCMNMMVAVCFYTFFTIYDIFSSTTHSQLLLCYTCVNVVDPEQRAGRYRHQCCIVAEFHNDASEHRDQRF